MPCKAKKAKCSDFRPCARCRASSSRCTEVERQAPIKTVLSREPIESKSESHNVYKMDTFEETGLFLAQLDLNEVSSFLQVSVLQSLLLYFMW